MEPGLFSLHLGGVPAWKQHSSFSSLKMHVSPPRATEEPKTGNCGVTRTGTHCWLSCAVLGGECALLHGGGSALSQQKRKSILSAQAPSSQDPTMLKPRLLFPAAAAVSLAPCCGRGRWFPFFAVSAQSTAGLSASKRWGAESCCCHGNNACTEQQRA